MIHNYKVEPATGDYRYALLEALAGQMAATMREAAYRREYIAWHDCKEGTEDFRAWMEGLE